MTIDTHKSVYTAWLSLQQTMVQRRAGIGIPTRPQRSNSAQRHSASANVDLSSLQAIIVDTRVNKGRPLVTRSRRLRDRRNDVIVRINYMQQEHSIVNTV